MARHKTYFKLDEAYAYVGWIVLILASGGAIFPSVRIMLYQDGWLSYGFYMLLTVGFAALASKAIVELGRRRYHITINIGEQLRIQSHLGEQPITEQYIHYAEIDRIRIIPATERGSGEAWFDFSYGYIGIIILQNGEEIDLAAGSAKQLQFRIDELQEVAEAIAAQAGHIKAISPLTIPPSQQLFN
jgi:hypothetical protein